MLLTANLGDAKTFSIPLRWGNRQFIPGTEWNLTFTAKRQPDTQLDSAASIQKQLGSDFLILNNKAKIKLFPSNTSGSATVAALNPGLLNWDIQAQNIQDPLDIRTVAGGTLCLFRDVTRGGATYVPPSPGAFSASLNVSYAPQSVPYYRTTLTINYSYVVTTGTATAYAGTITPASSIALNAVGINGAITDVENKILTLGGSITGMGTNGAGSTTIPITGTVNKAPIYYPAFYKITNSSTPPTWTIADVQTPSSPTGLTITYPNAQETDYAWLATKLPITSIKLIIEGLGEFDLPPTVISSANIAGEVFNLYGLTGFVDGVPVKLKFN